MENIENYYNFPSMSITAVRSILNNNQVSFFLLRSHEIGDLVSTLSGLLEDPALNEEKLGQELQRRKIDVSKLDLNKILLELRSIKKEEPKEVKPPVDHSASSRNRLSYRDFHDYGGFLLPKLDARENDTLEYFQSITTRQQIEWSKAAGHVLEYNQSLMNLAQYSMYEVQREGESILNSNSPQFNIPAFFILKFEIPARALIEQISNNDKVKTKDVIEWLDGLAAHLPNKIKSLNIEESLLTSEYMSSRDFIPVYLSANQDLLLSLGIHKTATDGGDSLGYINESLTKEIETHMGRRVPVYTVSNLAGNSGNASAWTNYITMSVDSLISIEMEHREFKLWKTLNDAGQIEPFPKFMQNPQMIHPWIYMNVYGQENLETSLKIDKEERLNEERWHSDFTAFGMAKLGKKIVFSPYMKEESVEWALSMLKPSDDPETLFVKMNNLNDIDDKFKFALDLCEVQALIASLTTSPAPIITLYRAIAGVALPKLSGKYYPEGYEGINNYLTSLLSEPLLGEKTIEPRKWITFFQNNLQDTGNIQALDEKIKAGARKLFEKHFLTPEEMNREIPDWREKADKITKFIKT